MTLAHLAALNAVASGISTVFVAVGWWAIRRQQELAHVFCMVVATVASAVFLAGGSWGAWRGGALRLPVNGPLESAYTILLISHVVLACVLPVLMAAVYVPVWRQHWNVHRRVGKLVTPVWLYVAATGVLVNVF